MESKQTSDDKDGKLVVVTLSKNPDDEEVNKRGQWASEVDYFLSVIGFCVSLGNVWRFPYICNRNGGGAFLIPFIVCLVLCGLPLFLLEVALGQFSAKSPLHIWSMCPMLKGVGFGVLIMCFGCTVYFTVICAWSLYFAIYTLRPILPWTVCDNVWNTDACVKRVNIGVLNCTKVNWTEQLNTTFNSVTTSYSNDSQVDGSRWNNDSLSHTAAEEFWQYKALGISTGIHHLGPIKWELALCLFASWVVIFICVARGVKSVGKAVYVTATFPYIILIVLLVRGLTLPGGTDGALFYITPDFNKLLEIQVWLEACLQVFYSLGPAWGCIITMASYTKFNTNCLRNAIVFTFVCEGTSLFAGLVVFSVLGFMAHEAQVPITDVVSSGPGLGFVIYPEALAQLPLPQVWSFLFFIMLIFLALDSMGGVYVFQLLDWYLVAIFLIFTGLVECVTVAWIYGIRRFNDDIEMMIGRQVPLFFKITWCYVTPAMLLTTLIFTFIQYQPPTYGKYVYPHYSTVIGWIIAVLPMIPRIKMSLAPDASWIPADRSYREQYLQKHGHLSLSNVPSARR
ncbi:sodium- and chloride-dependent glycine transporter 2-like [Haliotis rubra]|uniref:sodium- and chloride-dependent glycine transporter 2-like n=1 Tax=Haliotis rubra TaxID=36100 RepID=UPI001EE5EB81|nr:sodium- and chloride-dependent glycine transporter 2-like [Haliotis rubra]